MMKTRSRFLPLVFIASILACNRSPSGPDNAKGKTVKIVLVDEKNQTPSTYSLHITPSGGSTISACCTDGVNPNPAIEPSPDGFRMATDADTISVVIKATGFQMSRAVYTRQGSGGNPLRIQLKKIDTLYSSQDFATVFPPEGGREQFLALAVNGSGEAGTTYTVKFYIDRLDSVPVVYFQNTRRHPLHYNFVRDVLGRPMTLGEFEERTYHGANRSAIAGSIVWRSEFSIPGDSTSARIDAPMTMEFFPSDDLTPGQALLAGNLIEDRIQFPGICGKENRIYYLPPTVAHETALRNQAKDFEAGGMRWITRESLYRGISMQLLNAGEAYGTLRFLSPENLITSSVSYREIILLSRLPNALPLVGGTITEELQTPLSHVNVAARSRKTPNLALLKASTQPAIAALRDSLVHFRVTADTFVLEKASLADAQRFWETLNPGTPVIPAPDLQSITIEPFSRLGFSDRTRIGVKAANLAELSNLLPGHAPEGFAVPFSHYADFLGYAKMAELVSDEAATDCNAEGRDRSLCADVAAFRSPFCADKAALAVFIDSLLANTRFQADSRFREASLDGLRYMMRHLPVDTAFARSLDSLADSMFRGKRVRLRSSTNAEDLEDFSGAGLYSSTGADASGPELPSLEIRKVWASVWNWQAFEERSFRGIDHRKIYLGVAVHPAFTEEAANGVLITRNLADPGMDGFYVNVQLGEASVTNPIDGSLPEIFTLAGGTVIRQRYSSLSPKEPVMTPSETTELGELVSEIQFHFAKLYDKDPRDPSFALDLEFKLDAGSRALFIKQVRPYPQPK